MTLVNGSGRDIGEAIALAKDNDWLALGRATIATRCKVGNGVRRETI